MGSGLEASAGVAAGWEEGSTSPWKEASWSHWQRKEGGEMGGKMGGGGVQLTELREAEEVE